MGRSQRTHHHYSPPLVADMVGHHHLHSCWYRILIRPLSFSVKKATSQAGSRKAKRTGSLVGGQRGAAERICERADETKSILRPHFGIGGREETHAGDGPLTNANANTFYRSNSRHASQTVDPPRRFGSHLSRLVSVEETLQALEQGPLLG